jgi:hypothetical protein
MDAPTSTAVINTIATSLAHDRAVARPILMALWERIDTVKRPDLACLVAHYVADTMEDTADELRWDLHALDAAHAATVAGLQAIEGVGAIAVFYPSLHLNLGDVYLRLGDFRSSERHLADARSFLSALPDGLPYAALVKNGVNGLALRLEQARRGRLVSAGSSLSAAG